nr:hypothetical protein [Marinobacter lipolyticus]
MKLESVLLLTLQKGIVFLHELTDISTIVLGPRGIERAEDSTACQADGHFVIGQGVIGYCHDALS